mmetsp:Transcript_36177/g.45073  ORF Transcript_36177/g.45073 Transcript_36177/m.45073 type:complete len:271 (+) Transcript_36177:3644-4456(+)
MPGVITAPAVVPPACKLLRKSDPLGMRRYAATLPFSLRISPFTTRTLVSPSSALGINDCTITSPCLKDPNLLQIIDVILRQGLVMVQSFIPSALEGDTRVLVVNGEILKENGKVAAYRRIPNGSDFRSNLHAGGTTAGAVITPGMRKVVASVGPYLRRDGLFLVGLDFIGDKICEVNVHSPGGTRWASALTGVDFTNRLWDEIERHCANVKNTRSETFLSNKNQNQTENLVNININKRTAPTWANSFCSTRSRRGKRVKTSKPISANSLA